MLGRRSERGQVLVLFAVGLVVFLGFAALAIDIGRMMAERRHLQTAADAGALAGCQYLIEGSVADVAAASARARSVAEVNISGSPSGSTGTMATTPVYEDQNGDSLLGPDELTSGVVVSTTSVRVAISSTVETTLARAVGISTLGVGARAHCTLEQQPALPIVVRRYAAPPGPGFVDVLATEATSTSGGIDSNPLGYDGRSPAGEDAADNGPLFEIYGTGSMALNSPEFRGFINLDIRDFRDVTLRDYYNGAEAGENENTMKAEQAAYVTEGYPGPAFPAATTPPTGDLQVATLSGHNTGHLLTAFDDVYDVNDRIMLGVYDGTVKAIPDFAITPPSRITLPATTIAPVNGPTFRVSKNAAFTGLVDLTLQGDAAAPIATDNILPIPGNAPPAPGKMNEPVFSPDNFTPSGGAGTTVAMQGISTTLVSPGVYTVWLKGTSTLPAKVRRHPVAVYVGGVTRSFNLDNSALSGSAANLGDAITYNLRVRGESWSSTAPATQAALSWDISSLSTCTLAPVAVPPGMTVSFSSSAVTPSGGSGALSTMTVETDGLASGCYMFTVRARATNSVNQPVTRLATVTMYVASEPIEGEYVEIIGFAMFKVTYLDANTISGRAISPICADPNCAALRRVQRARLIPWS
ncbi:MAG: Tad domain-containing protein [Chloroflexota bacterium]|nr:Tad domain-containing protein [Chloroflexota bacterium]